MLLNREKMRDALLLPSFVVLKEHVRSVVAEDVEIVWVIVLSVMVAMVNNLPSLQGSA